MLGAPGSGKGTTAKVLAERTNLPHISTGDMFREQIKKGTELGKLANSYISQGNLVPDEVTIKIVEERLKDEDVKNGLILDGFPRTIDQAKALDLMLEKENKNITLAINLETPEEEIIDRIVSRRVCSNQECKTVYNTKLNPPKVNGICDKCGEKLIQRKDDNEETVRNRLIAYYKQSAPIVDYYKNKDLLYSSEVSIKINKMAVDVAEEVYEMLTR